MRQSKRRSAAEALANSVIGLVISWLFTLLALPFFGLTPTVMDATGITACFFFLSTTRAYLIRRMFDAW